jgi:hypothetical protein
MKIENKISIRLKGIKTTFTRRYKYLINSIEFMKRLQKFGLNINHYDNDLTEFEYDINIFVNDDTLDIDNDSDLIKRINKAKEQLNHVRLLRQQADI